MLRYQRVTCEINLNTLGENVKRVKKLIHNDTHLMAIVKADAYGHGAVESAKVALYNGADSLGVAILSEALQLINHNIHVPILILGYTPEYLLYEVVKSDLIQTVFSVEMAQIISDAAIKQNKIANIHIKIDTGMGRLGFLPEKETLNNVIKILNMGNINIMGIYSHFANSDDKDKSYCHEQNEKFQWVIKKLEEKKIFIPHKHISNSAAIIDMPQYNYNIVRPGIILYGLAPSENIDIKKYGINPVMSLKTHISSIKEQPKDATISYGLTYTTISKSIIATVPVGYADGYCRMLSNNGRVLVGGEFAPIVGRICMDQFMIDITHIKNVKVNDEVVLFGRQKDKIITADEIAGKINSINYEVVCMIGKRVPRVYMKNGGILKTIAYI